MRKHAKAKNDEMLTVNVTEPVTSERASPVVFASRKDGTVRLFVDYRRLKTKTLSDTDSLSRIDDCIDSLGGAVVFSTLNCNYGY